VNNGVWLSSPGYWARAGLYSSESDFTAYRPMLTIEYVPEPVTMLVLLAGVPYLLKRRKA
jgi:hypothetical protein